MSWHAGLHVGYRVEAGRTLAHATHQGPLRVLKALYPEGDAVCHHVLVHPPAGIVGGDRLEIDAELGAGSHALLTTPGATRFYRSAGPEATQRAELRLGAQARVEWLPMETLVYRGARARSELRVRLDEQSETIGWDVVALGLPAADAPFDDGWIAQRLELEGLWLDAGRVDASDRRLRQSPLGLAGRRVFASMWWACGSADERRAEQALEAARAVLEREAAAGCLAGVSRVHPQAVVVRALADHTEHLMALLQAVRRAWRTALWGLDPVDPRIWST